MATDDFKNLATGDRTLSPDSQTARGGTVHQPHRGAAFATVYVLVCAALGLIHLFLGADVLIVAMALGSILLSALPTAMYGWRDLPSLFSLLAGVRYVTSALVWKLAEFSPIDSGLFAPETSFTLVVVGTSATTAAVFAAHILWPGRPLIAERYDARGFSLLVVVGLIGTIIGLAIRFSGGTILGGIQVLLFDCFLILPMAYMGFNIFTRNMVFSAGLLVLLGGFALVGLASNSRQTTLNMLLAAYLMYVCYGFKVSRAAIAIAMVPALFFFLYVSPAITDARAYRDTRSAFEMIGITVEAIGNRIAGYTTDAEAVDFNSNLLALRYTENRNTLVERFVAIQQLDFLAALVQRNGAIGTERFWAGLLELLPSVVSEDKSVITHAGYALTVYGILPPGIETAFEVTVYANAFSFGGYQFTFGAVFVGFLLFFLVLRLLCPEFRNSIMAAFILAAYIHPLTAQTVWTPFSILARSLPFEILLFLIAILVSSTTPKRSS
jgi:hypothetical protein